LLDVVDVPADAHGVAQQRTDEICGGDADPSFLEELAYGPLALTFAIVDAAADRKPERFPRSCRVDCQQKQHSPCCIHRQDADGSSHTEALFCASGGHVPLGCSPPAQNRFRHGVGGRTLIGTVRKWRNAEETATAEREWAVGSEEEVLSEQRAYYRGRAPEYDEWWQRRGRYDRGEEEPVNGIARS
jgi:hypothetical protein